MGVGLRGFTKSFPGLGSEQSKGAREVVMPSFSCKKGQQKIFFQSHFNKFSLLANYLGLLAAVMDPTFVINNEDLV